MEEKVQNYYGQTLKSSEDLQTSACKCSSQDLPKEHKKILSKIHDEIMTKFYGCGSPLPPQLKNCTVLDLGCGTGRDVYLASALVGDSGKVIGIDMTDEQLQVANKHIDYHRDKFGYKKTNVEFIKGNIEKLPINDSSIDVVISNCVINLAINKIKVFQEIYRVLKFGGEFYFSDIFSDRRIPYELTQDKILYGECLTGALYFEDFRRLMTSVGFVDFRVISKSPLEIENTEIQKQLNNIKFYSITIRAFKLPNLEDRCENYGHTTKYLGTIEDSPINFKLDKDHTFIKDEIVNICGNTADMLLNTRYHLHFETTHKNEHTGLFDCGNTLSSGCC